MANFVCFCELPDEDEKKFLYFINALIAGLPISWSTLGFLIEHGLLVNFVGNLAASF